jgi:hypothetical protein
MALTILQVIAELDRAGLPSVAVQTGEVLSMCPCCPGEMTWTDELQRWKCANVECPSRDYPSAIGNELHFRSNRYAA